MVVLNATHPVVTVITPTYNRARYLPETIASVLGQTYPNIEYLVLDDGSTDNTEEVLLRYASRLRWEKQANEGETYTVNKGLRAASGEFITIVNSDDPIKPTLIETAVAYLKAHPSVLMVYPDWDIIDESSMTIGHQNAMDYDYRTMVEIWGCIPGPGAVLRRKAVELEPGRDLRYKYVADFEYWLRLGLHGPFARIPRSLATHRTHSASAGVALAERVGREIVELATEFFGRPGLPREILDLRRAAKVLRTSSGGQGILRNTVAIWISSDPFGLIPRLCFEDPFIVEVRCDGNLRRSEPSAITGVVSWIPFIVEVRCNGSLRRSEPSAITGTASWIPLELDMSRCAPTCARA